MWPFLNAVISLLVGLMMAYKLGFLHDKFTFIERVGMGLLGAGCIMTIGPILMPIGSPYENWSGFLMRAGILIFFAGRVLAHDLRGKW